MINESINQGNQENPSEIKVQTMKYKELTGKTAAEIVYSEADAKKIYMGLKTWKCAPNSKILKSDVAIAKNYLNVSTPLPPCMKIA